VSFEGLSPVLKVSEGEIAGSVGLNLTPEGLARVGFHYLPGDATAAEFRLELVGPEGRASEVWLYRWTAHEQA
jgi:periplasmic glucans biosynthesis protein